MKKMFAGKLGLGGGDKSEQKTPAPNNVKPSYSKKSGSTKKVNNDKPISNMNKD